MTNFKKLLFAAPLLASSVLAQDPSTTDANPVILVTTAVATTNVVVLEVPYTTEVDGTTTILTTQVSTTVGADQASTLTSIIGSISSNLESISSVISSVVSDITDTAVVPSVTTDTAIVPAVTTITSVGGNGTVVLTSTLGVPVVPGGGNATATGGDGSGNPTETGSGNGPATTSPNAANVGAPVQMGGLMVALLVAVGML